MKCCSCEIMTLEMFSQSHVLKMFIQVVFVVEAKMIQVNKA